MGDFYWGIISYLRLENWKLIFYTAYYEDFKSLFFTSIGRNFCDADVNFNRFGMDDADYVHDEVFIEIRN